MSLLLSNFLLLRTPLNSFNEVYRFPENQSSVFEEGLYISSREYWQEYKKKSELSVKEKEKIDLTFSKYWVRSCMRSTPYGTFAGSLTVDIDDNNTQLILSEPNNHFRSIRIDMNYVNEIINSVQQLPEVFSQLKFYPNNSIYKLPNYFRYAEYTINNNIRNYQITSIDSNAYTKAVLLKAAEGATISELASMICEQEDVSMEESILFIKDMIQSQLLISELEPCVTGAEPLNKMIEQLERLTGIDSLVNILKNIQRLICRPVNGVASYQHIERELKNLGLSFDIPKNTLQVDLFLKSEEGHINKGLIVAVTKQVEDLMCLARERQSDDLKDFKNKFHARYEDAEIPLAIAWDADLGIGDAGIGDESAGDGYLIDNLALGKVELEYRRISDYIEQFIVSKYFECVKNKNESIDITEIELLALKEKVKTFHFANSMYLMGSLLKKGTCLDSDNFVFDIANIGGPSAANLLGRFTHGDKRLSHFTKELLAIEEKEYPNAIYAEIAHLPQARVGNVLLRPVLRSYEIPYVGKSGAPLENQITVDDLVISIRNNELVLRSRKHNKRVIPRLTTAHNFGYRSLPVYKFLCDLQSQGIAQANIWDWGSLSNLKHLPRVKYKDIILQKAKWQLVEQDIGDLSPNKSDHLDYFKSFCEKLNIPSRVVYAEGDNELLIDFTEDKGIRLFLHYLKRYKNIQLEEFLFTDENCVVHDAKGNPFTNEVIIPLHRKVQVQEQSLTVENKTQDIQRKFSPNSEWQYFKVYCGSKTAEKILSETVHPFIERGLEERLFEQFFFIRYRDESGHFRIRFYNKDKTKQPALQTEFMQALQPLLDEGTISKVMLDTYNREIERYSGDLMETTESLFHNDSLAVLRFISMLEGTDSGRYRMFIRIAGDRYAAK